MNLDSPKTEAPRLIVSINQANDTQAWVVAGGCSVKLQNDKAEEGFLNYILDLFACYYAWDLSYPQCFEVLHFLQDYLLNDNHECYKNSKYKVFEKNFMKAADA